MKSSVLIHRKNLQYMRKSQHARKFDLFREFFIENNL